MPSRSDSSISSSSTRLTHLRSLDGLRGIAVLAVVLYHFSPSNAPGGFLGVDVFFVLSGFLITSLLVNEWESSQRISLRHFWVRRARRLLPALFVVLIAAAIYAVLVATEVMGNRLAEDGLAALGYVANWHFIASGQGYVEKILTAEPSALRHTWSLAIEEQFYLVWPLIVVGVAAVVTRVTRRRGRHATRSGPQFRLGLTALCVALGTTSLLLMIKMFDPADPNRVYYGTDTRAFLLLLGAAIGALTAGRLAVARRAPRNLLIVIGCGAAVALAVTMAKVQTTDSRLYEGGYGLIAVAIGLVLVAAAQPGFNPLARVLESRALVGLGLISYGVYLWHWPATVWLTEQRTGIHGVALFALRAAVTLGISIASYLLVEQPIRRQQLPRWTASNKRVLAVATAIAVAILLAVPALAFSSVAAPPKFQPSATSAASATNYAEATRCDASLAPAKRRGDAGPKVQLFGNSVAVEVAPCLRELVEAQGGTLETVVQSGRAPCHLLPRLEEQVANPETRPDIAIFSAAIINIEDTCDPGLTDWLVQVKAALSIWKAASIHVYLVPTLHNIEGTAIPKPTDDVTPFVPIQDATFRRLAQQDPENVTVIDAGLFIRDANDVYQWRMPCLPGGEPGCTPDQTVGVRWVDGFHFCTDPAWDGTHCPAVHAGGERRVAAAINLKITKAQRS